MALSEQRAAAAKGEVGADEAEAAGALPSVIGGVTWRRPTAARAFVAMLSRDITLIGRKFTFVFIRMLIQPLLFVFIFAYVMPKIGRSAMFTSTADGGLTFSTILVPGLVASALFTQGMLASSAPLVIELSFERMIEDRLLAPISVWMLGLEKIVAGALQALVGAGVAFPIVLLVHSGGQAPDVEVTDWPLLGLILVAGALLFSSLGMLLATLFDPRQMQPLFTVVLLPATMLGCVYYPWVALSAVRWLQYAVLANPMVYLTEGLRDALTPQEDHMPVWAFLLALVGGSVVVGAAAVRSFARRVLD